MRVETGPRTDQNTWDQLPVPVPQPLGLAQQTARRSTSSAALCFIPLISQLSNFTFSPTLLVVVLPHGGSLLKSFVRTGAGESLCLPSLDSTKHHHKLISFMKVYFLFFNFLPEIMIALTSQILSWCLFKGLFIS